MINKLGYLVETQKQANKLNKSRKKEHDIYTGLDTYLSIIFPEVKDWVYRKETHNKDLEKLKPMYRSEKLKLVVELDDFSHYTTSATCNQDYYDIDTYKKAGYKCIRIPFFIQLTRTAIKELFDIEISEDIKLLPDDIISFDDDTTPGCMCCSGLDRCAAELSRFPEQTALNVYFLELLPYSVSGILDFKKALYRYSVDFRTINVLTGGAKKSSGGRPKGIEIEDDCVIRSINKLTKKPYLEIKEDLDKIQLMIKNKYIKSKELNSGGYFREVVNFYMTNCLGYKFVSVSSAYFEIDPEVSEEICELAYYFTEDKALFLLPKHACAYIKGYTYELEVDEDLCFLPVEGAYIKCDDGYDYCESLDYKYN